MDINLLQDVLLSALNQYHLNRIVRYHNIGFSSKDIGEIQVVAKTLKTLLPDYTYWEQPDHTQAPSTIITRHNFKNSILSVPTEGLIIQQPEQWLNAWPLVDKQAFWSDLGMWHGTKKVIVIFAASNDFQIINNAYFKSQLLDGVPIKLWLPARA